MQGNNIRSIEYLFDTRVAHPSLNQALIGVVVVGQHCATETQHDAGKDSADATGTDYANRLAFQLEAGKPFDGEVAFTNPVIRFVGLTVEGHNQGNSVFSHCVR